MGATGLDVEKLTQGFLTSSVSVGRAANLDRGSGSRGLTRRHVRRAVKKDSPACSIPTRGVVESQGPPVARRTESVAAVRASPLCQPGTGCVTTASRSRRSARPTGSAAAGAAARGRLERRSTAAITGTARVLRTRNRARRISCSMSTTAATAGTTARSRELTRPRPAFRARADRPARGDSRTATTGATTAARPTSSTIPPIVGGAEMPVLPGSCVRTEVAPSHAPQGKATAIPPASIF